MIYLAFTFVFASIVSGISHFAYPQWPTLIGLFLVGAAWVTILMVKIEIAPKESDRG